MITAMCLFTECPTSDEMMNTVCPARCPYGFDLMRGASLCSACDCHGV